MAASDPKYAVTSISREINLSRTALQIVNVILAILTVFLGGASLFLGVESPVYPDDLMKVPSLDSNLRFLGGLGVGLGLTLLWLTPSIERRTVLFRAIWLCALAGGIGRLISAAVVGLPPTPMIVFTAIEVPAVPLLIYWQYRVATVAMNDR